MTKPYVIVHMMMSVDGRIDCGMTAQLDGNSEYYACLDALDAPTRVSGRVTGATEMGAAQFKAKSAAVLGKTSFAKNQTGTSYEIITDSRGSIAWGDQAGSSHPVLVFTSEKVSQDYLDYLNARHVSWIAAGKDHVDLSQALEILGREFGVKRLAVVGGGRINGGFLQAGLVDEVSLVVGPGVDGRTDQPSLFDGMQKSSKPVHLQLKSAKTYPDGALALHYLVK